jgi:hypothetical protein
MKSLYKKLLKGISKNSDIDAYNQRGRRLIESCSYLFYLWGIRNKTLLRHCGQTGKSVPA